MSDKFTKLSGVAAPLPMMNVDTDMIIPKQYLKTVKRTGLGKYLFGDLRYHPDGSENQDFILNHPEFRQARILITGDNFGCGSSREHAPWSLLDFGIRSIIAPSFADIFFNNCIKNAILPVTLPAGAVETLTELAVQRPGLTLTVDLQEQLVTLPAAQISGSGQYRYPFAIEPSQRHCLLEGLDDIALTLQQLDLIEQYEARQRTDLPWLW